MSTQTAVELKYPALLTKHNMTEADLPGKLKERLGLLKATKSRYEKNPTDNMRKSLEAYDLQICNAIQDIKEVPLAVAPPPTPEPAAVVEPIAEPTPEPVAVPTTKSTDEVHEEGVLAIITASSEKCIRDYELEKILGHEPTDPLQKVGTTTLRRQLHGKYFIYK